MYQADLANIARAEAARAYQSQFSYPMKGYTSPEQIMDARANAAYYAMHPGGMRGQFDGRLDDNLIGQALGGLGEAFDQKTLMYAAAGAIAGMYIVGGHNVKSAGMGAVAGFLLSKVM